MTTRTYSVDLSGYRRPSVDPRTVTSDHHLAQACWRDLVSRVGLPAAQGVMLLLVTGVIVVTIFPFQLPDRSQWQFLGQLSAAMTALLCSCVALPWQRLPEHTRLLFPVSALVAVWSLSMAGDGLGAAYIGVFVFAFVYVGLYLPLHSCWLLLPVAVVLYGPTLGGWTREISLRAVVIALVWVLVAEVLATLSSRHRAVLEALQDASRTDALSGLDNRRALQEHLGNAPVGTVFAVFDLDHFKEVNDTHGHAHGDQVLAEFARVLRHATRAGDHAVRYGGEEFLLMLQVEASGVPGLLIRLHQAWALSSADITFSCGWAVHTGERSAQETLAAADRALYVAKGSGRNRDVAADPVVTETRRH